MAIGIHFDRDKAVQMFESLKSGAAVRASTRDEMLLLAGVCFYAVTYHKDGIDWNALPINDRDKTADDFLRDMHAAIHAYAQLVMLACVPGDEWSKVFGPQVVANVSGLQANISSSGEMPNAFFTPSVDSAPDQSQFITRKKRRPPSQKR